MGCVSPTDPKKGQIAHKNAGDTTQIKNHSLYPDLNKPQSDLKKDEVKHSQHRPQNKEPLVLKEDSHLGLIHEPGSKPFSIEPKPVINDSSLGHQGIKQTGSKYLDNEIVKQSLIHDKQVIGGSLHQKSPQNIQDVIPKHSGIGSAEKHVTSDFKQSGTNSLNIELNLNSNHDYKKGEQLEHAIEQKGSNIGSGIKQVDKNLEYSNTEHKNQGQSIIRRSENHEANFDYNDPNGQSAIHAFREGSQKRQNYPGESRFKQIQATSGKKHQQVEQEMCNEQYLEHTNFFFKLPEIKLVFDARA